MTDTEFAFDPAAVVKWGVRRIDGDTVMEAETRLQAEQIMLRPGMSGEPLSLVCRLDYGLWPPDDEWRSAADAPLLERIALVTYERDWALEELANWTGALR